MTPRYNISLYRREICTRQTSIHKTTHSLRSNSDQARLPVRASQAKSVTAQMSACHTYDDGLDLHLHAHGFTASDADACLYTCTIRDGTTIAAIAIDDFPIMVPTRYLLDNFRDLLRRNYTVKDLGQRTDYMGWKLTRYKHGAIHGDQHTLICKIRRPSWSH